MQSTRKRSASRVLAVVHVRVFVYTNDKRKKNAESFAASRRDVIFGSVSGERKKDKKKDAQV